MTERLLGRNEVLALCGILNAAIETAKVARLMPNGDVVYGIARAITDEHMNFLPGSTDIRDGYLWVTTQSGMEANWPLSELIPQFDRHEFAQYDW